MSISYPLTIPLLTPGNIGPSGANLRKCNAVPEFTSPFSGQAEQQQFADQHCSSTNSGQN